MMPLLLFVAGRTNGFGWDVLGVFDSEDKAATICTQPSDFYAAVLPNRALAPDNFWGSAKYPRGGKPSS